MSVVVIQKPVAVVSAAEARAARVFNAHDPDEFVNLLLAAAQSKIDGPHGWLNRAIGEQKLKLLVDDYRLASTCPINLPFPQIVSIEEVGYRDGAGEEQFLDSGDYTLEGDAVWPSAGAWPWGGIPGRRGPWVTYVAGWKAPDAPAGVKHAIMLMASELRTIGQAGGIVRREDVEGIGLTEYVMPDAVARQLATTADRLLHGYRIFRV